MFCFFLFGWLQAQPQNATFIYVYLSNKDYEPSPEFESKSRDGSLNTIFTNYAVTNFVQSFPNAINPVLNTIYEIHANGEISTLLSELESFGVFDSIFEVEYSELLSCTSPVGFNDAQLANNWMNNHALDMIEAQCAWSISTGDNTVIVGVVDTEFQLNHEDLIAKNIPIWGSNSNSPYAGSHGTRVAGVIGAVTNNGKGVASLGYNTGLSAYSVGYFNPWPGIWAAGQDGVDIINVSYRVTGEGFPGYIDVLKEITSNGTVVVVGAGNIVGQTNHSGIWNIPGVLIVGGVDMNNYHGPTTFSRYAGIDLCAPSINVSTTEWYSNNLSATDGYSGAWGTSFAAPLVSAAAALIKANNQCLSNEAISAAAVEAILKGSTDPIADGASYPGLIGTGRLNAYKALLQTQSTDKTITTNTTWDNPKTVFGNLIVEAGAVLTITSKVYFGPNSRFIVKQNGKVVVDGGELTAACMGEAWKGIEVWGTYSQNQSPSSQPTYQGMLVLNNSTVSHAVEAVQVWEPGNYNSTGGVVITSNTKFLNNKRSVSFLSYKNMLTSTSEVANRSSFSRTTFEINEEYRQGATFLSHISMWDVKGISISGCDFQDARSSSIYNEHQGVGIYTIDAGFNVDIDCNTAILYGQPCPTLNTKISTFKGLSKAIFAMTSSTNNTFKVQRSEFNNNAIGLHVDGVDNFVMFDNIIDFGTKYFVNAPSVYMGMFITGNTAFTVESNDFKLLAGSTVSEAYGIRIQDHGSNSTVYKNTFTNLKTATFSEGYNISPKPWIGLKYECNSFAGSSMDMKIAKIYNVGIEGIQGTQGTTVKSAGNTFSSNITSGFNHIANSATYILYYHNSGNTNPAYTLNVGKAQTGANSCVQIYGAKNVQEIEDEIEDAEVELENLNYSYHSLIDNGNSLAFQSLINTEWGSDIWDLRNGLLEQSPYLSITSLVEALELNILPNAIILEICLANPDATRESGFVDYLRNMPTALPENMIALIEESWSETTVRTILETAISEAASKLTTYRNEMANFIKTDSITNYNGLPNLVSGISLANRYGVVESYISRNDFSTASSVLASMESYISDDEYHAAEYSSFVSYLNLRSSYHSNGKRIANLDSTDLDILIEAAASYTGEAKHLANNILCFFYSECPSISEPETRMTKPTSIKANKAAGLVASVFPNPASEFASFRIESPIEGNSRLVVYDITGKVKHTETITSKMRIVDVRQWEDGIYIYRIFTDNNPSQTGKLIIKH